VDSLSEVEEFINIIERMGCVNIAEYARKHKVNWVEIREKVRRQLKARGYDVRFEGSQVCISKREDVAVSVADFLMQKGCVHRMGVMNIFNITGKEWKRVKRKVLEILGAKGYKVYKYGGWIYCIEGARPEQAIEMTIPLFVKIDAGTMAKLEELAKKRGVSKAEIVREIIAEYLEKQTPTS
jgi:hypothetical protein